MSLFIVRIDQSLLLLLRMTLISEGPNNMEKITPLVFMIIINDFKKRWGTLD